MRHFAVDKIGGGGIMHVQIEIDQIRPRESKSKSKSKSKRTLREVVRNSRWGHLKIDAFACLQPVSQN